MKDKLSSTVDLFTELRHIKNGTYDTLITKCRLAYRQCNYELYNDLKSSLPCVTFSGIFAGNRKASDIGTYNHLIVFDIDNIAIDKLKHIRNFLEGDSIILALWLSPSGIGLKGLVRTDNQLHQHRGTFDSLKLYLFANYSIDLDRSGSDVSRLCFSSYDPDIYYNHNSDPYNEILVLEGKDATKHATTIKTAKILKSAFQTEGLNKIYNRRMMKHILTYLQKNSISITSSYDEWLRVALSISYTFSYDVGVRYFLKLCELDKELHSEQKSLNLLRYCYKVRNDRNTITISFGTILFYAQERGFQIKKTDNGI